MWAFERVMFFLKSLDQIYSHIVIMKVSNSTVLLLNQLLNQHYTLEYTHSNIRYADPITRGS